MGQMDATQERDDCSHRRIRLRSWPRRNSDRRVVIFFIRLVGVFVAIVLAAAVVFAVFADAVQQEAPFDAFVDQRFSGIEVVREVHGQLNIEHAIECPRQTASRC